MALTEHSSGTAALTAGTATTLATITTDGFYKVNVDGNALANLDEVLYLIVERKVTAGGTTREVDRFVIARGGGTPAGESDWFECQHELVFKLLQEGGTGRSIPWDIQAF